MRLALYQPDIAQNVGSLIRLCACFNVSLDIIEPCGFPLDMRRIKQTFKQVAMDYSDHVEITRHVSWEAFLDYQQTQLPHSRICLLTTKGSEHHHLIEYQPDDILLCGRESAGVPEDVHARADLRVKIPMAAETRSLNIASAATIVLAEGLRQTNGWPSA